MTIAERLDRVHRLIGDAAAVGNRNADDVTLIAVSKTQPAEAIIEAIEAGQVDFGENRIQEAAEKWPAIKEAHPQVRLHLMGGIQRNKLRDALGLFDVIHSLDRPKLARSMARLRDEGLSVPPSFIQVNTGEEPQKGGLAPKEVDDFVRQCREDFDLPITGLMCIPPNDDDPALHFALLSKLGARNGLENLSMGMSGDFEMAVEMGATHIRVGTAIFGPRRF